MKFKYLAVYFSLIVLLMGFSGCAQQLAFPSAEGFGRYASGGRGGEVYTVTNLNDDGEGSLRKGIVKHGPRIITFAVSGTISLQSPLDINNDSITIAGQTAPGDGICVKGYTVSVKADNVIIRYLRFRLGDVNKVEDDALKGKDATNVILDHCSMSWATDENSSFYRNKDFTMQWCIVSESLNSSVHHKGDHGYGGIWGGVNASFHHNLIASNHSRNPRFSGSSTTLNSENEFVDFRNNVIYNWQINSIYGGENGTYNVINNYFKPGEATEDSKRERILDPYEPYGKFYVAGNFMEGSPKVTSDNWDGGVQCEDPESLRLDDPVDIDNNIKTQTAEAAYFSVLKDAGASLSRDAVDIKVVQSTATGKPHYQNGIIDSQDNIGGWPELKSKPAPEDSDHDGMPDKWEKNHNLDPKIDDSAGFDLDKNYTNIEVYLNELAGDATKTAQVSPGEFHFSVAKDGSGDFCTVQDAIDAVPDFRQKTTKIGIKSGIYYEKLILPESKINVELIGENRDKTILVYDDYSQKLNEFGEEMGTTGSSSFFVFGNDFKASNITFQNSAGKVGQAVAVRVDSDRAIFKNCNFLGNQDTLYLHGKGARQYFTNCLISGTVDFIFGWSTAVFENCTIVCKEKGYITAASTTADTPHGFVFLNCDIQGDESSDTFYLGRPWRDHAKTVFINCTLDKNIKPEGWHNWKKPQAEKTAFYAEYNSQGPGADAENRVAWSHQLTAKSAAAYEANLILKGEDNWQPKTN
ncbi:pectinesterase family protein [Leeuwenhoekiella sp. A16]|uniref:pectinesterase family protein n=1 Tax=unclassified Leeuwenhoekiella TaxID=2615029 RepID=UPI003A80AD6E